MHIIIAGSGTSNRNNTEALLQDYLAAKPDITLVLPAFRGEFSAPQIHAAQLFEDLGKDTILVTRSGVEYEVLPYSTKINSIGEDDDILEKATAYLKGQTEGMFILWNDDDPLSVALLVAARKKGVQAVDLTDGLVTIVPPKDLEVEADPIIPEEEEYNDEDDDDDDEDEDLFTETVINEAMLERIAEIFAKAVARELRGFLK